MAWRSWPMGFGVGISWTGASASLAGGLFWSSLAGNGLRPRRCLQDAQDRFHLAVGRGRRGTPSPGGREDGAQVLFRHIQLGLELLDPVEQAGGSLLGFDPGGLVILRLSAKMLGGRHGLGRLARK